MARKKSMVETIKNKLNELNIGDSINKADLFKELHDANKDLDYFQRRSLDVSLCNAKKLMLNKKFNSRINNLITRTK